MNRIFIIIMEYGLGLSTGTIAIWGTLVLRILTVDHTFNLIFAYFDAFYAAHHHIIDLNW